MAHHHFPWREPFLAALREVPVVSRACAVVGIERSTAYRAAEADPTLREAWDDAMETGVDKAEQEAFRRAVEGFEEPVIDKGRLTYRYERCEVPDEDGRPQEQWRMLLDEKGQPIPLTVRKHSDALLALFLKGRRKKVYADRTELTGADGGPVAMDGTNRAARAAALLKLAEARKAIDDLV